jgi:hypothetical protein
VDRPSFLTDEHLRFLTVVLASGKTSEFTAVEMLGVVYRLIPLDAGLAVTYWNTLTINEETCKKLGLSDKFCRLNGKK